MGNAKREKRTGKGRGGGSRAKQHSEETSGVGPSNASRSAAELILALKPFWDGLTEEEQIRMLTVSVEDLRQRAAELDKRKQHSGGHHKKEAPGHLESLQSTSEALEEGLARLEATGTWKRWLIDDQEFSAAASLREFVATHHLGDELRALLLPANNDSTLEGSAKSNLNRRMREVNETVRRLKMQLVEDVMGNRYTRGGPLPDSKAQHWHDSNIHIIHVILDALGREQDCLYHAVLSPLTSNICNVLDDKARGSTPTHLDYADLERLSRDDLTACSSWLAGKVDSLTKPFNATSERERYLESVGDDDPFTLQNGSLIVNSKWFELLKWWESGESFACGDSPCGATVTLDWIFEETCTANDSDRKLAKRKMGKWQPTTQQALDQLLAALEKELRSEKQIKEGERLSAKVQLELLRLPKDNWNASDRKHPLGSAEQNASPDMSDDEMLARLQREALLTDAKLHVLEWELSTLERKAKQLREELDRGEPKFQRLELELKKIQNSRRRGDNYDHIEEHSQARSAFDEHETALETIYREQQRVEVLAAKQKDEVKHLKERRAGIQMLEEGMVDIREALLLHPATDAKAEVTQEPSCPMEVTGSKEGVAEGSRVGGQSDTETVEASRRKSESIEARLKKLKQSFQLDVRHQQFDREAAWSILRDLQRTLRDQKESRAEGRAALKHLEMYLVNVSCDNAGARLGSLLIYPVLQHRLVAAAQELSVRQSLEAQEALVQREEEERAQEELERAKKQTKKQKKRSGHGRSRQMPQQH